MLSAHAAMFMVELEVMARICVPFPVWNAGISLACVTTSWPIAWKEGSSSTGHFGLGWLSKWPVLSLNSNYPELVIAFKFDSHRLCV